MEGRKNEDEMGTRGRSRQKVRYECAGHTELEWVCEGSMGDAYLEYPETREGTVGAQRPVSDHGCLRARRGPCESKCRPEGSGASRWEKTGTVVLGSENNEFETGASQQPVGVLRRCYGSGKGPMLLQQIYLGGYATPRLRCQPRLGKPAWPESSRFGGNWGACQGCEPLRLLQCG